jgi:hypothetical protein
MTLPADRRHPSASLGGFPQPTSTTTVTDGDENRRRNKEIRCPLVVEYRWGRRRRRARHTAMASTMAVAAA